MIAASFGGISSLMGTLQKEVDATERLLEILNSKVEIYINTITNTSKSIFLNNIHFKDVSFYYPKRLDLEILKCIDIQIPIGKQTAIVGSSGAGKSTIAQLLLRFY